MDLRANVTRMPGTGPQGGVDLEPNYYVRDPRGDGIKLPPRGRGSTDAAEHSGLGRGYAARADLALGR
jgi:hypothetical protein